MFHTVKSKYLGLPSFHTSNTSGTVSLTCAQIILNDVICRFGCPLSIHSDQGRNYESQVFQELCEILEIRKTRTTPRNPKCNGQVERFNRSLLSMIKSFLRGEQTNWDVWRVHIEPVLMNPLVLPQTYLC
jgi:transposase InsO family protein